MENHEDKDKIYFENFLKEVRSNFDDYTSHLRKLILQFSMGILALNWAIFGSFQDKQIFKDSIKQTPYLKNSVFFAVLTIFLIILKTFLYACYLKWEDNSLQKDFNGGKERFKERFKPESAYPYRQWTNWGLLFIDIILIVLLVFSFAYFITTLLAL